MSEQIFLLKHFLDGTDLQFSWFLMKYIRKNLFPMYVCISNIEIVFVSKGILQWRFNGMKYFLLSFSKHPDFASQHVRHLFLPRCYQWENTLHSSELPFQFIFPILVILITFYFYSYLLACLSNSTAPLWSHQRQELCLIQLWIQFGFQ